MVFVSANQSGSRGAVRFVAGAKVVRSGEDVLVSAGVQAGIPTAEVDVSESLVGARRWMSHLADRGPDTYRLLRMIRAVS